MIFSTKLLLIIHKLYLQECKNKVSQPTAIVFSLSVYSLTLEEYKTGFKSSQFHPMPKKSNKKKGKELRIAAQNSCL